VIRVDDVARLLAQDNREKRQARGGQSVGKKSPRVVLMPSVLEERRGPPWWQVAPPLVRVDIATGRVLVYRWPVTEGWEVAK
jgi:hypothetical protein